MNALDRQRTLLARGNCPPAAGIQQPAPWRQFDEDDEYISLPINCSAAGDNVIISPPGPPIKIYALQLWNVTPQTIRVCNGPSAALGSLLFQFTNFPTGGYLLGIEAVRYWKIPAGNPLILNCQNATQVDGFVIYRAGP